MEHAQPGHSPLVRVWEASPQTAVGRRESWCYKLDATTLRDPKVVKTLNERFVSAKRDDNKEQRRADGRGIDGFPTLVLATSGSKVVGTWGSRTRHNSPRD